MLRATCLGWIPARVSTWTSLTSPNGVTTTRAERTPVSPAMRFSIRFIPHGSGVPAAGVSGSGSCSDCDGFDVVTAAVLPLHQALRPGYGPRPWRGTARDRPRPARLRLYDQWSGTRPRQYS